MKKSYLEIGQIVGTHGVKGEVRLNPWCDSPEFVKNFKTLYFDNEGKNSIKVNQCRPHGTVVLLTLDGIDTVEKASAYRNKIMFMKRSDAKISDDIYFIQDLIDCAVVDVDTKQKYGVISQVSETGANDVWHIKDENGKETLIPAIPSVINSVDVESGIIEICPLKGLFDNAEVIINED